MKHFIISKNRLQPSVWDGGKTYEYFIYPPEATYAKRDFLFRVSAASIEKVPSHFTRFENYQRFLVMLDNDLHIQRNSKKEHYKKDEIFSFDSNDEIISQTLGNDFNLMISKEKVIANVCFADNLSSSHDFIFVYATQNVKITFKESEVDLLKGDVFFVENVKEESLSLIASAKCIIAFVGLKK